MKTYQIKLALHGVSPMVWRRLIVPGNTSLAKLHKIIQIAYGWDNDYLHQFHIYGVDYGITYPGGMGFRDNAHKVLLDDFEFDEGDKFRYEYNFFDFWVIDIRIEKIEETSSPCSVRCIKGKGMHGVGKYDEASRLMDVIEAIAHTDKTTTVGDIRELIEAYEATKFNRKHINNELKAELAA